MLLAGALVLGLDRDDAVGVDVEGDFDLRHTTRGRRDVFEVELAEHLVVSRHLALTLEHPDRHRVLVVFRGREHLALLGRDRRVAVDQPGEHAAQRFDAEAQRGHIEQHHVLDVALQHAGLDRRAHGHHLVGVHTLVRLLAEELGDLFDHLGHPGHAADEDDLVNVVFRQTGVFQRRGAGLHRVLDQVADEAFKLRTGELHHHVQRLTVRPHRDERLVDLGLARRRQLDLGFLGGFLEPLQRHLVFRQVDVVFLFELLGEVVHDPHVEVFPAEEGIAVGRFHFKQAIVDLEDGDVEGAAAKVIDRDRLGLFLVKAVGERRGGRLVDDAQHFEARDLAGVLGRLALGVVEIGGHGDDGLRHLFTKVAFGGLFHLLQDEGRNLARRILLARRLDPGVAVAAIHDGIGHHLLVFLDGRIIEPAPDKTLDRENGVVGVGDGLPLRGLTDEPLFILEGDDGGRRARPFRVLDNPRLRTIHVFFFFFRGAEVDTDDFGHAQNPLLAMLWAWALESTRARSRFLGRLGHPLPASRRI